MFHSISEGIFTLDSGGSAPPQQKQSAHLHHRLFSLLSDLASVIQAIPQRLTHGHKVTACLEQTAAGYRLSFTLATWIERS